MSLQLFAAPMSSATPVVCALAELEIDCEVTMLDLAQGRHRHADYLALNPHGVVPTLLVDGQPLFEALEILQWLGEHHGVERGLWPAAHTPERLAALSWTAWAYVSYGALLSTLNFAQSPMMDAGLHHPALAAEAGARLDAALGRLDARLAARTWLVGDAYSLADLAVACVVTYSLYCGVSIDGHPHVRDWLRRFYARPAYTAAWGDAPPMV